VRSHFSPQLYHKILSIDSITRTDRRPIIAKKTSVTSRHNRPLFLFHLPRYFFYSLRIQERIFQVASTDLVEEVSIASSQTGYKGYAALVFSCLNSMSIPRPLSGSNEAESILEQSQLTEDMRVTYRGPLALS
jgi:hypothetical protein